MREQTREKQPPSYDPKNSRAFNLARSAWAQMGIKIENEDQLREMCRRYEGLFDDLLKGKLVNPELLQEVKQFFKHISRDTLNRVQKRKRHWS